MPTYEWYEQGADLLLTSGVSGKTIQVMLLDDNFVFDAADEFVSDISANELAGGNYARGTMTNVSVIGGQNSRLVVLDGDTVSFPSLTGHTLYAAVLFVKHADGDSASTLLTCEYGLSITTDGAGVDWAPHADDGWGHAT